VSRIREFAVVLAMGACGSILYHQPVRAGQDQQQQQPPQQTEQQQTPPPADVSNTESSPQAQTETAPGKLIVTVGKSLIIDSPLNITRVTIANGTVAEAVAVNPKEVLINGTAAGETSLIVWQQNGTRLVYDLTVRLSGNRLEAVRQQLSRDFPNEDINVTFENDTAFVRGTVKDVTAAERAVSIVATLGKTINLLRVEVPPVAQQIALKVRFASVDRSATLDAGLNFWNGSFNQQTSLGTGYALHPDDSGKFPVPQAINILLFRNDINLVAELQALQTKRVLEILSEPNVLTISGEQASFLAGGEFPFPIVQPSANGSSAVSIQWREYGVRLNFLPVITPRGTIRLKVAPEVSSLDYSNAVTIQGFTVPGLSSRRVQTDVELDSGQTFVIAGLLDNQASDNLAKVPGISSIPVLGKLFQSKNVNRTNKELLVIITPELVRPIPEGQAAPDLNYPVTFLPKNTQQALHQPGMDKTGPVPIKNPQTSVPFEEIVPKKEGPPVNFQPNPVTGNPGSNLAAPPNPANPGTPPAAPGGVIK
jgi:pilus assembly protein CpaC